MYHARHVEHNGVSSKGETNRFKYTLRVFDNSKDSKEGIGDCRIQLRSSRVHDGLVDLVPRQKQELIAFEFLESAELKELYASMQISNPLL